MTSTQIADLFRVPTRFMRSAHLERDFADPRALDGYILSGSVRQALGRIVAGLRPASGQRAWRITGDYGTGKSSFGLVLAHLVAGKRESLAPDLRKAVDFRAVGIPVPSMLPVLITGAQEGLAPALARALVVAATGLRGRGKTPATLSRIIARLGRAAVSDAVVLRAVSELCDHVTKAGRATGVLIIIDELGKYLEFAAQRPAGSDVYILQQLAESAARSGDQPILLVGMLHQGFHAYAEQLPTAVQQEWEKVAGRFEEILFDQPLEHTSLLVAGALNVREDRLPRGMCEVAARSMQRTIGLGWYGAAADEVTLAERARRIYPLHATVLPVLIRFLRRFGQNERSLFSFLLSEEPFALQEFARQPLAGADWYRLHHLYDYVRTTYGHSLGGQSHRSHWLRIASVIDGARGEDKVALTVLKTVGLLNLIDADDLPATEDAIRLAVEDPGADKKAYAKAIAALQRSHVLYDRGGSAGLCLWPNTSVSLDRAFAEAGRVLGGTDRVASLLTPHLDVRHIVARRHHIETGTLRHFEVRFVPAASLAAEAAAASDADGLVLVPLCENASEEEAAIAFAESGAVADRAGLLIAVPKPLTHLTGALHDARRWQWVAENTPELNHDPHAAGEVARQLQAARRALQKRLEQSIGLHNTSKTSPLRWFTGARGVEIRHGRHLLEFVSATCNSLFPASPRISNELVNRRVLSSAAAKARMLLVQRILESGASASLGIDEDRFPPERSIYLSVLKHGGLHREVAGVYAITEPKAGHDPCNVRPTLSRIHDLLASRVDARVGVDEIFAALRAPPFGVRDGLVPLLFAIYYKIHEHEVALYENGAFAVKVGHEEFLRMTKSPRSFEAQLCLVAGVRIELFDQLKSLLNVSVPRVRKPQLLDVVTPLCEFAARLPEYSRKTQEVSPRARAVRAVLLDAREPATFLFHELPVACGGSPFVVGEGADTKRISAFVGSLRLALDELRDAFVAFQQRNATTLSAALDATGDPSFTRQSLASRARKVLLAVREPRLKAFCLRLADDNLSPEQWIDAVASFVLAKPPARWSDMDGRNYADGVAVLADTFRRVESMAFAASNGHERTAMRIVVTRSDGVEVDRVVHFAAHEEAAIAQVEAAIVAALASASHINLAAASRVFWKTLSLETSS